MIMKRTVFSALLVAAACLAFSCSKDELAESEFNYPLSIGTKASGLTPLSITDLSLLTEDDPEMKNTDFLSCRAWMNPDEDYESAHSYRFIQYDEVVNLMMFVPDIEALKPGKEITPARINFGYLLSNNLFHHISKITSGKIIYRGRKGDSALFEFQDVLFVTDPTRFVSDGNHLISGLMECPVYRNSDDRNKSTSE